MDKVELRGLESGRVGALRRLGGRDFREAESSGETAACDQQTAFRVIGLLMRLSVVIFCIPVSVISYLEHRNVHQALHGEGTFLFKC